MPRSTVLDALWREAASIFEDIVQSAEDEARLPSVEELQNHKQSLQDLVDILTDACGDKADKGQSKTAHQAQTTRTISSMSNSEPLLDKEAKECGKRKHSELSKAINPTEVFPIAHAPRQKTYSPADDLYIWETYLSSLQNGDKIPKDKKSPHGLCVQIAEKLGTNWQSVATRLHQLRMKHAHEEVCTHGYWTESDAASMSGDEEALEAKTPVFFTRKSSFSSADDAQIWNVYIRDGCDVKTAQTYTHLVTQLSNHEVHPIYHRLLNLVAADQGVSKDDIKLCLFDAREDEQILTAHRNNQQPSRSRQLSEKELGTMLGKVLHREPVRVLYRARKLLSEQVTAYGRREWEQRARATPRTTVYKCKFRPYSAEEANLLAEVDLPGRPQGGHVQVLRREHRGARRGAHHGHGDEEHGAAGAAGHEEPEEDLTRASLSANRLTDWAIQHSERLSSMDANQRMSLASGRSAAQRSHNMRNTEANKHVRESLSGNITTNRTISAAGGSELRPSFIGGSIRPNVPGNRSKF